MLLRLTFFFSILAAMVVSLPYDLDKEVVAVLPQKHLQFFSDYLEQAGKIFGNAVK